MKLPVLLVCSFFLFSFAIGQGNMFHVDEKIKAISNEDEVSTAKIADFIVTSYATETEKVRAAYTWVIHNIEYDSDSMYAINWNQGGSLKLTESFRRRKGVCENFAGLFIDIVQKSGLQGITIDGYTRQGNFVNKIGHTWSAVKVNGEWHLFDPTWDKDRADSYQYFMSPPSSFAISHMPFDPLWQLTDRPISHKQFHDGGSGERLAILNHGDSIKAYMRLGELEKFQSILRRLEAADKTTDLIKNRIAYLRMQVATIYEDRDMHLYNAAVDNFNKARDLYNRYAGQLNNGTAVVASADQSQLLESAADLLNRAMTTVGDIGKFMPNYQYDPSALKIRLHELSQKINAQRQNLQKLTRD